MLRSEQERKFAAEVAHLVHADKKREAAQRVAEVCQIKIDLRDEDPSKCLPILQHWLHYLMNEGGIEQAAQLLWSPVQFTPEPQFTQDLWKLFDDASLGLIMGAGSCSKSFGMGVRLFLEYLRDPEWTGVRVIGPSQDHLETNLFSHLVSLHKGASLPMPGEVGELFIGTDRRNQLGCIKGIVIPVGKVKKAGRLQGGKRKPRPTSHPIFGSLSRMFIFIDEVENVPGGIWSDIDNVLTQVGEEGDQGFKIFGAYNPTNRTDEVGKRAEPPFGWDGVDAEKHFRWKSIRGWEVLRLDGERSENVVQGKLVYPGLQTRAGLEAIARNAGGKSSPGYLTMGRGMYPEIGVQTALIPPGMFAKWRGEFIWYDDAEPVASCDIALEGKNHACFTLGRWGKVSGYKLPADVDNPKGKVVMFKDKLGQVVPRYGLQADSQIRLPKGDTVAMCEKMVNICKKAGVKPEYFCCDATGHGRGTGDLMKHTWSSLIHAVNYSEGPSKSKLMLEDTKSCDDEYDRLAGELWFGLRAYGEYGYLLLAPGFDLTDITQQVTQRLMKTSGRKANVESKKDFVSRGYESPDEADSLTLLVYAARKGSGIILSRLGEGASDSETIDDEWYNGNPGGVRIDVTNRSDYLNQEVL